MKMMKKVILWLAKSEMTDEYMRGWKAGVNQQLYEPMSAEHGHLTPIEYWGPDMEHMYEEVE